jgi:hypothetical protein
MANITGRITINDKEILEVDADPALVLGTPAPIGSLACYDSGTIGRMYIKAGAADTAWTQFDTVQGDDWNLDGNDLSGATFDTAVEYLGSNNNFDVIMKRNNFEIMRLVQEGLLIGLQASLGGRLDVATANLGEKIMNLSGPNGGSGALVIRVYQQGKVQTSDATESICASIAVPEGARIQAKAYAGCNQHGGSAGLAGDGADYIRMISAKRLSGGNVTRQKRTTEFTSEDVKAFNCKFQENTGTQTVDLLVTGEVNRDLAWSAHLEYMLFVD